MKKKKILSLLLSMVMATCGLFSIAGCSKGAGSKKAIKNKVVEVQEDSPWFDTTRLTVSEEYQDLGLDYVFVNGNPCYTGDGFLVSVSGSYPMNNDELDYENMTDEEIDAYLDQYNVEDIVKYDMNGNAVWTKDARHLIEAPENFDGSFYINGIKAIDDKFYVEYMTFDYMTNQNSSVLFELDPNTGDLINPSWGDLSASSQNTYSDDLYLESDYDINGYKITNYYNFGPEGGYSIVVKDPNGKEQTFNTNEVLPNLQFWTISQVLPISDSEILFAAAGMNGVFFKLDTNKMEMSEYEVADEIKNLEWYNTANLNGNVYVSDSEGVKEVNVTAGTVDSVFDFSECNVNIAEINQLKLAYVSDDEYVFTGTIYSPITGIDSTLIYRFTRADKNPNAGKTILSVSNLGHIDDVLAEAIYQFNSTNDKYFIAYDEKYSVPQNDIAVGDSVAEREAAYLKSANSLSEQLAVDLMAGEGPDIIIGAFDMQQLNKDDYLIDLSSYYNEMDTSDLFTNIIDASKINDKLYQMPFTYSFDMLVGPKGLSGNGVGFTFDEYSDVVSDLCNGTDPISEDYTKLQQFRALITRMSDSLIDEKGNIDFSSEEFKAICEYAAELPDNDIDEEEQYIVIGGMDNGYDDTTLVDMYANSSLNVVSQLLASNVDNIAFYAHPSYEGIGPTATIELSAAISASCANPDGAWEFIETIMSSEALSQAWSFTISRAAMEENINAQVNTINKQADQIREWFSEAEAHMYGLPYDYVDAKDASLIIDTIEAIESVASLDTQVLQIILEEIQPYFAGQKSLDDVIKIMADKCQTVIDERG